MSYNDWDKKSNYKVVVNPELLYSIWPESMENPKGWKDAGKKGSKDACLNYIEEVWTDMRPLELKQKMDKAEVKIKADAKI